MFCLLVLLSLYQCLFDDYYVNIYAAFFQIMQQKFNARSWPKEIAKEKPIS